MTSEPTATAGSPPFFTPPDNSGLIWGYAFTGTAAAEPLTAAQAQEWLAAPQATDGFIWLHFNLSNAHCLRWLEQYGQLDEQYFEALRDGVASTRIERLDDSLLAVINDIDFDFNFESGDIHTMWIQVSPRVVISARAHPLRSVDALRQQIRQGGIPESSTQLLELRRLLVRFKRLLAPEPSALLRLLQTPPRWMGNDDRQALRAASEEFSVFLRDMQSLEERIKLLQEEIAASINEDTNRSLYTLTMITVLALPVNLMAGLFGMNVGGIPLSQDPLGFWIVMGVVVAFSVLLAIWAIRKRRGPRDI